MNSDKLDKYFKEQIESLNSVSVPGANWNTEASWEKINQQTGGRKKVVFWWYLSGVAAVVILFLGFWFSSFEPSTNINSMAERKIETPLNFEADQSVENIISTEAVAEKNNKINEGIADKSIALSKESEAENQLIKNKRQGNTKIDQLAYLPNELSLGESEIQLKTPQLLKSTIESSGEPEIATAFNRTYIIRSKSKDAGPEKNKGTELKLRFDLAMNSEADPPTGILSNRGK